MNVVCKKILYSSKYYSQCLKNPQKVGIVDVFPIHQKINPSKKYLVETPAILFSERCEVLKHIFHG